MSKRSIKISFKAALAGLAWALNAELNFGIELLIALAVVVLSLFLSLSYVEWAVLVLTIVTVMGFELLNTAFERLSDLQKPRLDNVVKLAKDISAAAVLIVSLGAAIIGLLILLPHLLTFLV